MRVVPPDTISSPRSISVSIAPARCRPARYRPGIGAKRFTESGGLAAIMHQRTALEAWEYRRVDLLAERLVIRQDNAATAGAKRLVGRRGHDMGMRYRVRMNACGDEAGDVRHIHHEISSDSVGDFAELGEIKRPRISRTAREDDLRLARPRLIQKRIEIDKRGFLVNTILLGIEPFA